VFYSPKIALREWHLYRVNRDFLFRTEGWMPLNQTFKMRHSVADELGNCDNLPAVRGSEAILEAIRQSELRLTLRLASM
jgi:hypothetical protein